MQKPAPIYPSELIIVRHGESELNVRSAIAVAKGETDRIMLDQIRDADVPLTDRGREQAIITGQGLARHFNQIDIAYVSPYLRTRTSFSLIREQLGYELPVRLEDRIREREFGIFSQLTMHGIKTHYPQEASRLYAEGEYYYRPLGGESYPDMGLRLYSWLHSLYQHQSGKRILVVTHADVVQMLRKMLEKLSEEQIIELNHTDDVINCGITHYQYDPKVDYLRLIRYNEVFY
ncbi:histidine phosphatase family protein [Candidatus Saccharibacteria bacterium]|nr:histidine phosphatase family protein [Candidatus Saccharibacteria bacterium]